MDHTLRLIQYNWIVLAYNFNIVILVLIIEESSIGAISAYHFISVLSLLFPCIIILFLHLLSTNYKCTQLCYFLLLYKHATQKLKTSDYPRSIACGVMVSFRCNAFESVRLSLL
jgi:E3 ubiquitin-protein ligase DOA10